MAWAMRRVSVNNTKAPPRVTGAYLDPVPFSKIQLLTFSRFLESFPFLGKNAI